MTLAEVAERLGCRLDATGPHDGDASIDGVADLATARGDEIALFAHPRYKAEAAATQAGAVIVARTPPALAAVLRARNPVLAFASPGAVPCAAAAGARVSPHAAVAADAAVDPTRTIAHSWRAGPERVGAGSISTATSRSAPAPSSAPLPPPRAGLDPRACGARDRWWCRTAVIGSDGFGFTRAPRPPLQVPQVGTVVVEDDVEIGATTTIDRGRWLDRIGAVQQSTTSFRSATTSASARRAAGGTVAFRAAPRSRIG